VEESHSLKHGTSQPWLMEDRVWLSGEWSVQ